MSRGARGHAVDGYTDALVLEAPAVWWPPFGALHEHPLTESRSFCSAVAAQAVPHPTTCTATRPSVALSRLGRSVFMRAQWGTASEVSSVPQSVVRVWNPFSGHWLHLRVLSTPSTASLPCVLELVQKGRVRLCPRTVELEARQRAATPSSSLTASSSPVSEQSPADAAGSTSSPSCRAQQLAALTARHAHEVVSSCQDFLERLSTGHASTAVHAVLIDGGAGTGKAAVLDRVGQLVPEVYLASAGTPSACAFVLEQRVLDCAAVLAMDTREAVQIVDTVLRRPPTAPPAARADEGTPMRPAVVVALLHVELLWSATNAVTTAVIYQLCCCLDALRALPADENAEEGGDEGTRGGAVSAPLLILSAASDTTHVPLTLLRHLVKARVTLGATTLAERVACLTHLLSSTSTPAEPALSSDAIEGVAETLAGGTMASLLQITASEVRQRADRLDADRPQQYHPQQIVTSTDGPYGHLFGVDGVVTALEMLLVWPLTHLPELARLRIPCAKGAILYGPSGSGKTAVMRALAERLQRGSDTHWLASVQLVDGLTLVEKEVGRSEKNIAAMFAAARAAAPTVLLLDNLEALAPPRGRQSSETTTSSDRTLSALLTEMDGVTGDGGRTVLVIACAPSAEMLDPAVRRPGRLDVHLHLQAPSEETVHEALATRLAAVVQHLCRPQTATIATDPVLEDAVRARLHAARLPLSRADESKAPALSAAQVGAYAREVTLRLVRAVVGEAEALPAEGVALGQVLDALEVALKAVA